MVAAWMEGGGDGRGVRSEVSDKGRRGCCQGNGRCGRGFESHASQLPQELRVQSGVIAEWLSFTAAIEIIHIITIIIAIISTNFMVVVINIINIIHIIIFLFIIIIVVVTIIIIVVVVEVTVVVVEHVGVI